MTEDVLLQKIDDGIYELRMNRPERMNALGVQTVKDMRLAIDVAIKNNTRVLLVRGTGKAFCAGADLKERQGMELPDRVTHNAEINDLITAIASAPFVTLAVLNGLALGGGLEMALGCDLRIAAEGVSLGLTESRIGIYPGAGGTQRLSRLVGTSHALYMMLSGEPVSTKHALAIGLVNEVVSGEMLEVRAYEFARLLATRSRNSQKLIKQLVYQGIELPLAEGLKLERESLIPMMGSFDYAEGLAAFAERRVPKFPSNQL